MGILTQLYKFNKLRRGLGFQNALGVFSNLYIKKTGLVKIDSLKYPFKLRVNNPADHSTFNEVILRNEYDINISFKPYRILDCGANIGLSSVVFANKYPDAQIIAVEPEADNFEMLTNNISGYSNINALKSAIWSSQTLLAIEDNQSLSNAFKVKEVVEGTRDAFHSVAINDIMRENQWNEIDILKIDIEGAEKEIFTNGFESWLPKTKLLIVETHDRFVKGSSKALFAALNNYNFSCKLKGFNFIFFNED